MKQLLMRWNPTEIKQIPVPIGYHFVQFRRGGVESMTLEQFKDGYLKTIAPTRKAEAWEFPWFYEDKRIPDDGFFVVVSDEINRIVSTAAIQVGEYKQNTATLHMVYCDPLHRGKKLGEIVTIAAMLYAYRKGIPVMYLETDEHRIPAIKVYLRNGFRPVLSDGDMLERWEKVFDTFGITQMDVYDKNETLQLWKK